MKKILKNKPELFKIKPQNIEEEGDFDLRGKFKSRNDYVAFVFKSHSDYKIVMDYLFLMTKRNKKNYEGEVLLDLVKKLQEK